MMYLIVILTMSAVAMFIVGIYLFRQKSPIAEQVAVLTTIPTKPKQSYFEIRIRPWSKKFSARLPSLKPWITPSDIETRLAYSGNPLNLDASHFYGMQLVGGVVFAIAGFLLGGAWAKFTGMFLGFIFGGGFGIYYPIMWLDGRVRQRQGAITIATPDFLDVIATSMEAGLGFDTALEYWTARANGPLAEEIKRFLYELQMGSPRQECFRKLVQRNSSEELRTVVGALIQAYELGTPISRTLQEQAEDMRVRRIQRAKEEGAKAGPKITLVTTLLIAPAVMCLFIAIVALKVYENLGPLLQEFAGR
jgi:tight adherence protein C